MMSVRTSAPAYRIYAKLTDSWIHFMSCHYDHWSVKISETCLLVDVKINVKRYLIKNLRQVIPEIGELVVLLWLDETKQKYVFFFTLSVRCKILPIQLNLCFLIFRCAKCIHKSTLCFKPKVYNAYIASTRNVRRNLRKYFFFQFITA